MIPIEEIDVGMRVVTHGDLDCGVTVEDPRALDLSVPGYDGVEVTLLRAVSWVVAERVEIGASVPVFLEELGLVVRAKVDRIRHVDVTDGPGCLVDAVTRSIPERSRAIRFGGEEFVMTPSHPVYSIDRQEWIPVRFLLRGERVRGTRGVLVVESNEESMSSPHRVFNLSVSRDHTFVVGRSALLVHNTNPGDCGMVHRVEVSRSKHKGAADHIEDAQRGGSPEVLTLDRGADVKRRRAAATGMLSSMSGVDRDEYPPALFKEGGSMSSVRYVDPSSNRGAGSCIGHQCRGLPNGSMVQIVVVD